MWAASRNENRPALHLLFFRSVLGSIWGRCVSCLWTSAIPAFFSMEPSRYRHATGMGCLICQLGAEDSPGSLVLLSSQRALVTSPAVLGIGATPLSCSTQRLRAGSGPASVNLSGSGVYIRITSTVPLTCVVMGTVVTAKGKVKGQLVQSLPFSLSLALSFPLLMDLNGSVCNGKRLDYHDPFWCN